MSAARRPRRQDDLDRIERKLDRAIRLLYGLVLFQPVVIASALLPDETAGWMTVGLIALALLMLIFPRIERQIPPLMRRAGRTLGRLRRWFRPARLA